MFNKALSVCRPERLAIIVVSLALLPGLRMAEAAEAPAQSPTAPEWKGTRWHLAAAEQKGAVWREAAPGLKLTGTGRMSFLGLTIYDAALWTRHGIWKTDEPYALELIYARSISREQLVENSIREMQRTGTPRQRAEGWGSAMRRVFIDVEPGDRLIGVFHPDRGAAFYSSHGLIGEIADPEFARAFSAIWLDPRTREPALRRKLLGDGS